MLKRKIFRPITLVVLSLLIIFQVSAPNMFVKSGNGVVLATAESKESSVFDGTLYYRHIIARKELFGF